jgi:hypothetical protein
LWFGPIAAQLAAAPTPPCAQRRPSVQVKWTTQQQHERQQHTCQAIAVCGIK